MRLDTIPYRHEAYGTRGLNGTANLIKVFQSRLLRADFFAKTDQTSDIESGLYCRA